ncbi:FAD:protein FMN transferase [Peribacillus asahii]|uniref:FAD:protein FMN transferase n=1 Tax=Peribacillus asahii TaxID=228899 RepID=UPI0020792B78|nr:FAD:protein FMN transferase [Peribacillus asahii]
MTLNMEAMNTKFYVDLFSNEPTEWLDECRTWIRYVEKEWSRFLPDNELAMINDAQRGAVLSVSELLFDVLFLANSYYHKTEGLFSPYLLNVIESHGYNRSFPFKESDGQGKVVPIVELNPLIFNREEGVITKILKKKLILEALPKDMRWIRLLFG